MLDYEKKLSDKFKNELVLKINNFFNTKIEAIFVDKVDKNNPTFIFLNEKSEYEINNDPYLNLK